MDVAIYHPALDTVVNVPEESVWHYRQSGWVQLSEWRENQELAAKAVVAAEAPKTVKIPPVSGSKEK